MIAGIETELPAYSKKYLESVPAKKILKKEYLEEIGLNVFQCDDFSDSFLVELNNAGFRIYTDYSNAEGPCEKLEISTPISTFKGVYDSWIMGMSIASLLSERNKRNKLAATGWFPFGEGAKNAGIHIHISPFYYLTKEVDTIIAVMNFNSPIKNNRVKRRKSVRYSEYVKVYGWTKRITKNSEHKVTGGSFFSKKYHIEVRSLDTHFYPDSLKATLAFLASIPPYYQKKDYYPLQFLQNPSTRSLECKARCVDGEERTISEILLETIDSRRIKKNFGKESGEFTKSLKKIAEKEVPLPAEMQIKNFENLEKLLKTPLSEGGIMLAPEDIKTIAGDSPEEIIKRYEPQTKSAVDLGMSIKSIIPIKRHIELLTPEKSVWSGSFYVRKRRKEERAEIHPRIYKKLLGKKRVYLKDFEWEPITME